MAEIKQIKESKKNIPYFRIFIILAAVLLAYFFIITRKVYIKNINVQQEIAEVQKQIHDANTRRTALKKQYTIVENFMTKMEENDNDPVKAFGVLKNGSQYTETDSLIEQTAREKLGFVKSNEIIFIDKNK